MIIKKQWKQPEAMERTSGGEITVTPAHFLCKTKKKRRTSRIFLQESSRNVHIAPFRFNIILLLDIIKKSSMHNETLSQIPVKLPF